MLEKLKRKVGNKGTPRLPIGKNVRPIVRQLVNTIDDYQLAYDRTSIAAGYCQCMIRDWRSGVRGPSLTSFEDVANLLGYDVVLVRRKS